MFDTKAQEKSQLFIMITTLEQLIMDIAEVKQVEFSLNDATNFMHMTYILFEA